MRHGGGLKAVQKFVRCAGSRTHIKQGLTVAIVTANSVQCAYRKPKVTTCFAPLVAANDKRDFYGSTSYLERRN